MCTPHDPAPICDTCQVQISVRHILIECTKYSHFRQIAFREPTLNGILSESPDFSVDAILNFLRHYNILNKI